MFAKVTQVDFCRVRRGVSLGCVDSMHCDRVEVAAADFQSLAFKTFGKDRGQPMHAACNTRQTLGAVIDGVHAGHHCQQHLRRANVRSRLLAPDVLLARLQCQSIRRMPLRIDRYADQSPGQRAFERVFARHERSVRPTETERHAEALRVANDDVGVPGTGRFEQRQRQQIGRDAIQRTVGMGLRDRRAHVVNQSGCGGILRKNAEVICALQQIRNETNLHFDSERLGARLQHRDRLRMTIAGDQEYVALALRTALRKRHRLCGGSRFIEQRRIGDLHAGQVSHHRLEVDQRFHAALRNLCLIRGISRVPGGVLKNVAQDHLRCVCAVVALADEVSEHFVLLGDRADLCQRFLFVDRGRQCERRV